MNVMKKSIQKLVKDIESRGGTYGMTYWKERHGRKLTTACIRIGGIEHTSEAECSHKDQYSKQKGKITALGRAWRKMREYES